MFAGLVNFHKFVDTIIMPYWTLLFVILLCFGASNGDLDLILDRCCFMGAQMADADHDCIEPVTTLPSIIEDDQMNCKALIQVCCQKRLHMMQCQAGKDDAANDRACVVRQDETGAEQYKECCFCCKLGRTARGAGLPCNMTTIGEPCDVVFQECCYGTHRPPDTIEAPVDIDECSLYPDRLCQHNCENTPGSYRCTCNPGFDLSPDGRSCLSQAPLDPDTPDNPAVEDRCQLRNRCQQQCTDKGGVDVECSCFDGYLLQKDGATCGDIDECLIKRDPCPRGQTCVNTLGSYTCRQGTTTPPRCSARERWNPLIRRCESKCPRGSVYNVRTRRCERQTRECLNGYAFSTVTGECTDIDECTIGRHNCVGRHQTCHNTPGGFGCRCEPGYNFDRSRRQCMDINECAHNYDTCTAQQRCENTPGSYRCVRVKSCGTGYTLDARTQLCVDTDECTLGTHRCGAGYECRNLEGSFRCVPKECPAGYRVNLSTGQCEVIKCAPGLRADRSGNCVDINECVETPSLCKRGQQCVNSVGSYQCRGSSCPPGYELGSSGTRCIDIDECSRKTHNCLPSQECRNRPGSFVCQCPDGYRADATGRCEDDDECIRYHGQVCTSNAECQNTAGSYRCLCKEGFNTGADGRTCTDMDECRDQYRCEHQCINTYGSYQCFCQDGYKLAADKRRCEDVDECSLYTGPGRLCIGLCTNVPGTYTCSCPDGYRIMGDRRTCQNVDECVEGSAGCGPNAVCTDTRGGYKCQEIECPKGFYKSPSNYRDKSVRCQRRSFVCPPGDRECLTNPLLSFSYNFLSFPSKVQVPADLFTMSGPQDEQRRIEFTLNMISARSLRPGVQRINRNIFQLKKVGAHKAVVTLLQEIPGPQDIELELNMDLYSNTAGAFLGTAKAKIFIYVTSDEVH